MNVAELMETLEKAIEKDPAIASREVLFHVERRNPYSHYTSPGDPRMYFEIVNFDSQRAEFVLTNVPGAMGYESSGFANPTTGLV